MGTIAGTRVLCTQYPARVTINTKTGGLEYFPSSYLSPVPTAVEGDLSKATFPRSTNAGTLDELRQLLLVPLLSYNNKVPVDVYV